MLDNILSEAKCFAMLYQCKCNETVQEIIPLPFQFLGLVQWKIKVLGKMLCNAISMKLQWNNLGTIEDFSE